MELSVRDELYARSIGWQVLDYLKGEHPEEAIKEAEEDALRILEKIQAILNDDTLDDSCCFERIERIVKIFYAHGLSTNRHDWG